jgi:hypothetical protein
MWARHLELMTAFWLALSPFVLRYPGRPRGPWLHDFCLALLVACIALACHAQRLRRLHLAQLPLAAWLVGSGWWIATSGEPTPASQNQLVVGLLIGMFAIIPSDASQPPESWRADQSSSST